MSRFRGIEAPLIADRPEANDYISGSGDGIFSFLRGDISLSYYLKNEFEPVIFLRKVSNFLSWNLNIYLSPFEIFLIILFIISSLIDIKFNNKKVIKMIYLGLVKILLKIMNKFSNLIKFTKNEMNK